LIITVRNQTSRKSVVTSFCWLHQKWLHKIFSFYDSL